MRDDVRDEQDPWVSDLLARHADRHDVDVRDFTDRVLAATDESPAGVREVTARRRFAPALVAAAAVAVVALTGSLVVQLTGPDRAERRSVAAGPGTGSTSSSSGALTSPVPTPAASSAVAIGTPTTTSAPTDGPGASPTGTPAGTTLASRVSWGSASTVLPPRTEPGGSVAFKDPTVVRYGGSWHVFVTTVRSGSLGLGYLRFSDWSQAASAPLHDLSASAVGPGYRAGPQVFWFAPQKLWYLVYQTGQASYSTNPDIDDPDGWSAPKSFYGSTPDLIRTSTSDGASWLGMWVVCDDASCFLFSSDNHGRLFRSSTSTAAFPSGMSPPVVAAESPDASTTFAAARVFRMAGTGRYLLLAQAFGPDGRGYLRSWTSRTIDGRWTPLADTSANPFVGASNVPATQPWAADVVHGELLRQGYDQTLTVDPCRLELLALGLDARGQGDRTFRIGLLTASGTTCR